MDERKTAISNFNSRFAEFSKKYLDGADTFEEPNPENVEERFMQGVFLLQEFALELAGVVQAKVTEACSHPAPSF